jgi:hypothetical protein
MNMRQFLRDVRDGKQFIQAESADVSALAAFQPEVGIAEAAFAAGYITKFLPRSESTTGNRLVRIVQVGHLTDAGLEYLDALGAS